MTSTCQFDDVTFHITSHGEFGMCGPRRKMSQFNNPANLRYDDDKSPGISSLLEKGKNGIPRGTLFRLIRQTSQTGQNLVKDVMQVCRKFPPASSYTLKNYVVTTTTCPSKNLKFCRAQIWSDFLQKFCQFLQRNFMNVARILQKTMRAELCTP